MTETELLRPGPAAAAPTQPTITELVGGIVGDFQTLIKQQGQMLPAEFQEDLQKTKQAGIFGGLSIVLSTVGGIALVFALVYFLYEKVPHLPMWGSWAIVGGVFLAAGVVCGIVGKRLFESFNPLPDKTFNALQENLSWTPKSPK